jgi:hypothetical protein
LRTFQSTEEALSAEEISRRSSLSLRTVKTYLPKLVKRKTLSWSLDKNGKTKRYTLHDKSQFGRPLEIRNERRRGRKEQAKRLLRLGLNPLWLRRKPKRFPDWRESAKMVDNILDPQFPHTSSYVKRETGMGYKSHMSEGHKVHVFSIMHQQRPMIPKATEEAKAWARTLHSGSLRRGVAPHRYKYGGRPLKEEAWVRYEPCPKCGEWIGWFPCRKCGYVSLKEKVAH